MDLFDIFKGQKNKKGYLSKVRSVGYGYYDNKSDSYELQIYGLEQNKYILRPEINPETNCDYVIYYKNLESKKFEQVGVGHLLNDLNAGLIRLEWDFYDSSNIYISLSKHKIAQQSMRLVA